MCKCEVCEDSRRWIAGIKFGTEAERLAVFNEMFGRIELAETDLSYFTSIMDGSWPNGKQLLENALEKYNNKTE